MDDSAEPLKKHDVEEVRHRIANMVYHKPKSHAFFLSEDNKDKENKTNVKNRRLRWGKVVAVCISPKEGQ